MSKFSITMVVSVEIESDTALNALEKFEAEYLNTQIQQSIIQIEVDST